LLSVMTLLNRIQEFSGIPWDLTTRFKNYSSRMMSGPRLLKLAEGRFTVFRPLLEGLQLDDLLYLDVQVFTELAPENHRLLAYVFWKKNIAPLLESTGQDIAEPEDLKGHQPRLQPVWKPEQGYLSYNGMVINDRYATKFDPQFLVSELPHSVQDYKEVKTLDLSFSGLCDENMEVILEAVKRCRCHVLILRNNRLQGKTDPSRAQLDKPLLDILNLPFVRFVDITMNLLASNERLDFFLALTRKHFAKLIFIPVPWVEDSSGWSEFLENDSEQIQLCQQAHRVYYKVVAEHLPVRAAWLKGSDKLGSAEDVPLWQAEQITI